MSYSGLPLLRALDMVEVTGIIVSSVSGPSSLLRFRTFHARSFASNTSDLRKRIFWLWLARVTMTVDMCKSTFLDIQKKTDVVLTANISEVL
jgi:hypothetical protein